MFAAAGAHICKTCHATTLQVTWDDFMNKYDQETGAETDKLYLNQQELLENFPGGVQPLKRKEMKRKEKRYLQFDE